MPRYKLSFQKSPFWTEEAARKAAKERQGVGFHTKVWRRRNSKGKVFWMVTGWKIKES